MNAQIVSKLSQFLKTGLKEGATVAGERLEKEALRAGVKAEELDFAKLPVDPNKRYTQSELSALDSQRDDVISESLATPPGAVNWQLGKPSGGVRLVRYHNIVLDNVRGSPNYRERVTQFSSGSDLAASQAKKERVITHWKKYNAAPVEERRAIAEEARIAGVSLGWLQIPGTEDGVRAALDEVYSSGRYSSGHFSDVPNYLMHTRYTDDALQGKSTRLLMEIQSDLHQGERVGDVVGLDASPWKNSWLRKGIERELVDAHNKGIEQVAIPISEASVELTPAVRELFEKARTAHAEASEQFEELTKWYAKQAAVKAVMQSDNATKSYVLGAAKDAGIQLDPDLPLEALLEQVRHASHSLFKEAEEAYELYRHKRKAYDDIQSQLSAENSALAHKLGNSDATDPDFYAPIEEWARQAESGELNRLARGEGVQKWYETEVLNTAKKIAKATGSEFEEVVDDGVKYAVIRPKGNFNVSLYSSPVAAYFGVRAALDEGYSEEEVQAFAAEQGYDYEEAKRGAEMISQARADGYSDEEIKGFLDGQVPTMEEQESQEILSPPLAPTESVRAATKPEQDLGMTLKEFSHMTVEVLTGESAMMTQEQVDKQRARYEEAKRIVETGEDTRPWYRRWSEIPPEVRVRLVEEQKGTAYAELISEKGLPLEKIVANLQTIQPNMTSVLTRTGAWFGNEGDRRLAQEAQLASRKKIIQAANAMPEFQSRGLTLDWEFIPQEDGTPSDYGNVFTDDGQFVVIDAEGKRMPFTPGFIESIKAEGYEISGAIAGGFAGAVAGAQVPGSPWVKASGAFVGSVLGAAGLSVVGSQLDYLQNALQLQQDLDGTVAASRALSAGQASIIGDVIAWPVAKVTALGAKGIARLKDILMQGREYGALKELFFVSDDELEAIRQGLLKVTDLPGSVKEQRIAAYALTQPGGEDLLKQVANVDPKASRAVSRAVDLRAKDVLRTVDEIADQDIARLLSQDLSNYTSDVKAFYQSVKEQAAAAPRASQFVFNFDELGIEPALTAMEKELVDPSAVERYLRRAHVIRSRSDARGFADLLELRQLVNEFKFGSGMKKATDLKIFNDTLAKIDEAIDQGADIVLDNPQQWKAQYAAARAKYAEMKSLEKNVLARALRRPGIDSDGAVKAITRYITASDDTFADVLNVLPKQAREKVENSVIKAIAEKYTAGIGEAARAAHFPMMAEELKKMPFTTQEARRMKAALIKLGDTFKNDVAISQHTGALSVPQFQSYLTADPVVRLQYEFATSVFNYVRRLGPGQSNRALALVMKTADLLESPLNAKTAKELADLAAGEVDVVPSIVQMQQNAARQAAGSKDPTAARIKLWGDGDKLSLRGSGTPTATIPVHRIATAEQVNTLAAKYGINPADTRALDWALQQEGFKAVAQGTEKVRILK